MSVSIQPGLRRIRRIIVGVALGAVVMTALPTAVAPAEAAVTNLWGSAVPARVGLASDRKAVELGTRFTPKVSGSATGIRFYKVAGAKGKHTGTLWSSGGKKLATVTFKKEKASGWQSASFKKAVKLKAGKTYVVSYHVPKGGRYAITTNFSGSPSSAAFTLPKAGAGVYKYGSKVTFPRSKWRASQYWVDVNFKISKSAAASLKAKPKPAPAKPTTSPTPTTSPAPTTAPPSSAPSVTASPSPSGGVAAAAAGFPTRQSTGVPSGWTPKKTVTGDYIVKTEGAVVEDLRLTNGVLYVRAKNVTLRRVELSSARIVNDYAGVCYNGLRIEDTSILRGSKDVGMPAVESGGYTALRVKIDGPSEGFRAGEKGSGCGPIVIQDSWAQLDPPDGCTGNDYWHGDGLQGYMGPAVTIKNSYINLAQTKNCVGTSALFYPDQGNTKITVDRLLLAGGGYVFRTGTPGSVSGLKIIDDSWTWGPVDVEDCSKLTWGSGNEIVTVNSNGT